MLSEVEQQALFESNQPPKKGPGRPRKYKPPNSANELLAALEFASLNQKRSGPSYDQYCTIKNGWVTTNNIVLSMAHPFPNELETVAQTISLKKALSVVTSELSISKLENSLIVNTGRYRLSVPTLSDFENPVEPDQNVFALTAEQSASLRAAFSAAFDGVTLNSKLPAHSSLLITPGNSAVGRSETLLVEAWHGVPLPTMLIPGASARALLRCGLPVVGFGFSGPSCTFWFENGAWLRTVLWNEPLFSYEQVFEHENQEPEIAMPDDFAATVKRLNAIDGEQNVILKPPGLQLDDNAGASIDVPGLNGTIVFNVGELHKVAALTKRVRFGGLCATFSNGFNVRGAIAYVHTQSEPDDIAF